MQDVALHRQAFANRCSRKIYDAFAAIFGEGRLHVSVDNWGLTRGAKDNPKWEAGLKPHWDLNPWQFLRDVNNAGDPGYQGLIALSDQNLETGCHLTLPGCTHFLPQWCMERRLDEKAKSAKSFRAAADDPLLAYMQPIPLRRGQMVIWSWGQLHGSTNSQSQSMRLMQYVRMYPAPEAQPAIDYEGRDRFGCVRVLRKCTKKEELPQSTIEYLLGLDTFSKRLLGLESWHDGSMPAVSLCHRSLS